MALPLSAIALGLPHETVFLRLGWRTLLRDLRAGELRLLMVAVTLAVAALTSVGFCGPAPGRAAARRPATAGRRCRGGQRQPHAPGLCGQGPGAGLANRGHHGLSYHGRASDAQGAPASWWPSRRCGGLPLRGTLKVADAPAPEQATRDIPAPARCGSMPPARCPGPGHGRPAPCWAMPSCALPASSSSSLTGVRAS